MATKKDSHQGVKPKITTLSSKILHYPLSPFLIVIWLILARYNRNVDQLAIHYTFESMLIGLLIVSVITAILVWRKKSQKSYLVFAWFTFAFFIYGDLYAMFAHIAKQSNVVSFMSQHGFVLGFLALCSFLIINRLYQKKVNPERIVYLANVILIVLVLFNFVAPIKRMLQTTTKPNINPELASQKVDTKNFEGRDVYYLLFDRYGSNETLKSLYGYDNSEQLEYLRSKGFFLNENAHANYQFTTQSVASTFNLRYFEQEASQYKDTDTTVQPYYDLINHNSAGQFIKKFGYKYFHIGSWWEPTKRSAEATTSYNRASRIHMFGLRINPNEFTQLVLQNTLFEPLLAHTLKLGSVTLFDNDIDIGNIQHDSFLYQVDTVKALSQKPGDKFVFAHFLMPHPPFVFDANGNRITEIKSEVDKKAFIEQLKYTNTKMRELVEHLQNRPGKKPIIIVQADEGPYPKDFYEAGVEKFDWNKASTQDLQEKFGIISAYYLPDNPKQQPYMGISPVNTFRLLFNNYFGTDLKLLPDRSYLYERMNRYYNYIEITDRLDKAN